MVHLKRIGLGLLFWLINAILTVPLFLVGLSLAFTGILGVILFCVIVWYIDGALIEYLAKEYLPREIKEYTG